MKRAASCWRERVVSASTFHCHQKSFLFGTLVLVFGALLKAIRECRRHVVVVLVASSSCPQLGQMVELLYVTR